MNVNAKQLTSVDFHSMDITTALGFFMQIKDKFSPKATLTTPLVTTTTVVLPWTKKTRSLANDLAGLLRVLLNQIYASF